MKNSRTLLILGMLAILYLVGTLTIYSSSFAFWISGIHFGMLFVYTLISIKKPGGNKK